MFMCFNFMDGKCKKPTESCDYAHRLATEEEKTRRLLAVEKRKAMDEVRRTRPCPHLQWRRRVPMHAWGNVVVAVVISASLPRCRFGRDPCYQRILHGPTLEQVFCTNGAVADSGGGCPGA